MKNDTLHTLKTSGFKIPNAYFEDVDHAILSKVIELEIADKVDSSGFEVPADYFDALDENVLKTINENKAIKVVPLVTWRKITVVSAIAASIVLALNIFFERTTSFTFENLETASIETYLMNEDLTAYDMAPYLEASDINSENFIDMNIKASVLEDYLLENSDLEHLIED